MNHHQVAHRWAQQSGKATGSGSRMFFEGASIFSHGHHWTLARFTEHRGKRAVLLQVDSPSRSVSTHTHYRIVRDAVEGLPGVRVFEVPDVDPASPFSHKGHVGNARELLKRASAEALKSRKARKDYTRGYHLGEAVRLREEALAYARFFGVLSKLGRKASQSLEDLADEAQALRGAALKREREKAQALRAAQSEQFKEWRAGTRTDCPWSYATDNRGSAYLAVVGDEVRTSRGASVPIDHARRALAFVRAVWARGEDWHRNGETLRVGHFQVDSINADEVRAGCHKFTRERIEELSSMLDNPAAAPSVVLAPMGGAQ